MRHARRYPGAASEAEGVLGLALWESGATAIAEEGDDLVAYFDARVDAPPGGAWERVDERDYVGEYFAGLAPIEVGPLVIAPTHREVTLRSGGKALWLDPGTAFGTGHHESTRLVLEVLVELDLVGASVLDVGAGSGVLAMTADLLGAGRAVGVDVDPETVRVARENARANRSRATFACARFGEDAPAGAAAGPGDVATDRFDVVLANLVAEAHAELQGAYAAALRPGGTLVLSGIVDERVEGLAAALAPPLELVERRREGAWWALRLRLAGSEP